MSSSSNASFMLAVQWEGTAGDVSVNVIPRPELKEPEDALVRITSSAICGSDLHIYHGLLGSTKHPQGIGHEAVGIIEKVGSAVDYFKKGDRVVILAFAEDGHFLPKPTMLPLEDTVAFGLGEQFGADAGLQTEYVRIPWADSSLAKIPTSLSDQEWLTVSDIFPTGWTALSKSGFEAGDTVAVFGAGPVGLMCAYSAILRGASLVYVIDHVSSRLAKATAIGAVPINFTAGGKASEQILALRPAGVKRSVDCVGEVCINDEGKPQQDYILREAVKITRANGGIGIIGIYITALLNDGKSSEAGKKLDLEAEISFPVAEAWFKGLRIEGGLVNLQAAVPPIVELIKNGRARPGFVFSNEYNLHDAPLAYRRFDQRKETKIVLKGKRRHSDNGTLSIRSSTDSEVESDQYT